MSLPSINLLEWSGGNSRMWNRSINRINVYTLYSFKQHTCFHFHYFPMIFHFFPCVLIKLVQTEATHDSVWFYFHYHTTVCFHFTCLLHTHGLSIQLNILRSCTGYVPVSHHMIYIVWSSFHNKTSILTHAFISRRIN